MTILTVRDAIAAHYRGALTNPPVNVFTHGGAFGIEDLKRYAERAPCIAVACLQIPRIEYQGTVTVADCVFAAFCITKNGSRGKRDAAALLLAEAVMVETNAQNWDGEADGAPRDLLGSNLYSPGLDKMGIAIWSARWRQKVDLSRNATADLDNFDTLYTTYDIAPDDGDAPETEDATEDLYTS